MDWLSKDSHWMLPKFESALEKRQVAELQRRLAWVKGHVWIASSGTTRQEMRWIGLSKSAFLASASAVNEHLKSTKHDIWLNILPTIHVGGLSIFARASLSKAKVVDLSKSRWDARRFVQELKRTQATLTSLVPTQVYDLTQAGLEAPSSLQAIVVGGGALSPKLYERARKLGWPLLPSYGLTECCSQVATAALESLQDLTYPELKILSHVQTDRGSERLRLSSKALGTFVATFRRDGAVSLEMVAPDGWLKTEDFVDINDGCLRFLGRTQDRVKILGELVSIPQVEETLRLKFCEDASLCRDVCVLTVPHERKGHALVAVVEGPKSLLACRQAFERWHSSQSPLWRLDQWYAVENLARSALGKVLRSRLQTFLGLTNCA